jgi:hypothetical protein
MTGPSGSQTSYSNQIAPFSPTVSASSLYNTNSIDPLTGVPYSQEQIDPLTGVPYVDEQSSSTGFSAFSNWLSETSIDSIPNWMLLAGAGVLIMAMMNPKKGRG